MARQKNTLVWVLLALLLIVMVRGLFSVSTLTLQLERTIGDYEPLYYSDGSFFGNAEIGIWEGTATIHGDTCNDAFYRNENKIKLIMPVSYCAKLSDGSCATDKWLQILKDKGYSKIAKGSEKWVIAEPEDIPGHTGGVFNVKISYDTQKLLNDNICTVKEIYITKLASDFFGACSGAPNYCYDCPVVYGCGAVPSPTYVGLYTEYCGGYAYCQNRYKGYEYLGDIPKYNVTVMLSLGSIEKIDISEKEEEGTQSFYYGQLTNQTISQGTNFYSFLNARDFFNIPNYLLIIIIFVLVFLFTGAKGSSGTVITYA